MSPESTHHAELVATMKRVRPSKMLEKLRYRVWSLVCKRQDVCPANAYSLVIWGYRQDPRIDSVCRQDCERNGSCWCGKLGAHIDGVEHG